MLPHELYRVLRELKPAEIRQFTDFIRSPYFNDDPVLVAYLELLISRKGRLLRQIPSDEDLLSGRFEMQFASRKEIYTRRNQLLDLLEQFLLVRKCQERSFENNLYLAEFYRRHKLSVRCDRSLRKARQELEREEQQDARHLYRWYSWRKFELEEPSKMIDRKDDRRIESVVESLDAYYLAEKMKYSAEMLNREKILPIRFHHNIPPELLPHPEAKKRPGILSLYIDLYAMLANADREEHYDQFERSLNRYQHILSKEECYGFFVYALNSCVRYVNQRREAFVAKGLALIDQMEQADLLQQDRVINPWVFKNAVQLNLRKNQAENAQRFWEKYGPSIPESHRESVVVLAQAQIAFALQNYEEIFSLTNQLRYLDYHLVVSLKLLACKARLQLDQRDRLEGELEAFKKYLHYHREHLDKERLKLTKGFISIISRINHLQPGDKAGLQEIRKELQQNPQIAESGWLQQFLERQIRAGRKAPSGRH